MRQLSKKSTINFGVFLASLFVCFATSKRKPPGIEEYFTYSISCYQISTNEPCSFFEVFGYEANNGFEEAEVQENQWTIEIPFTIDDLGEPFPTGSNLQMEWHSATIVYADDPSKYPWISLVDGNMIEFHTSYLPTELAELVDFRTNSQFMTIERTR